MSGGSMGDMEKYFDDDKEGKRMKIEDIKAVYVHWSESSHINKTLSCNDDPEINKKVDKFELNEIIKEASTHVISGYNKTMLSVRMMNGDGHINIKFYLNSSTDSLVKLIKSGIE